jgi:4-hydroxybenzoyl-CoA thioesterase
MSPLVHRRRFTIEWGSCDPAGIVFNSRFFEFFDESTWELFESVLGVPRSQLFAVHRIVGIPLVDARARFLVPVKFGDAVELGSHVSTFRRSSFDVEHQLWLDGELAVEGRETRVWAAPHKKDSSRMVSTPIPTAVIARFDRRAG